MVSKGNLRDDSGERKTKPPTFRPASAAADREAIARALEGFRALQTRQHALGTTGSHEELRRVLEEGRD